MSKSRNDEERIDIVVSRNIRYFRVARHLSQTELGDKLGVSFQQIQKYEKGTNSLPTGRLRDVCLTLKITPNELFGWSEAKEVGHDLLPSMSPWAIKLAFKADKLRPHVRGPINSLIEQMLQGRAA